MAGFFADMDRQVNRRVAYMTRSKKLDVMIWIVMVLVAVAVAYLGAGGKEGVRILRLASGVPGTLSSSVAGELKSVLERHGPYKVVFVESANSVEAAALMREGKADLALMAPAALADTGGWVALSPVASLHVHLVSPRENAAVSLMRIPTDQLDTGSSGADSAILAFSLLKQLGLIRRDALLIDAIQAGKSAKYALRVEHPLELGLATLLNRKDKALVTFKDAPALAARDGQWVVSRLPAGIHAYPDNQQPEADIMTLATPLVLAASEDISDTQAINLRDILSSPPATALFERLGGNQTLSAWHSLPKPGVFAADAVSFGHVLERALVWWIEHIQVTITVVLFLLLIILQRNWWNRRRDSLREQAIRGEAEKALQELLRIEQRLEHETAMSDLVQLRLELNECKTRLLKRMSGTPLMGSALMLGFLAQWGIVDARLAMTLQAYRPAVGKGLP